MKALARTLLIACALAVPGLSFAQSVSAPVTRAEVRAELIRLEQAGYTPGRGEQAYPDNLQAAEAKVQAMDSASAQTAASSPSQPQGQSLAAVSTPRIDAPRDSFSSGA